MFKKILIPTDGSALATQAALEGIDYAKRVGAEVICVYVAGENQATAFAFSPHAKQEVHWPTDSEYKQIVAETSPSKSRFLKSHMTDLQLIRNSRFTKRYIQQG